jgi:hypothetical protein
MIRARKLHVFHVVRRAHSSTCGERYMNRFECVGLHAPLVEPGLDCVEVGLELLGSYGGVTVQCENGCVVSKGCYGCCWGGWKVRGVYEILEWPENIALGNTGMNWG